MTTHARTQPPVEPTQLVEDEFEPDAEWKAALKARIELCVASLVEDEKKLLYTELYKPGISDSDRTRLEKQYKQVVDIKSLVKKQYDIELEKERNQRRWNAGQPMHPESYIVAEQERILNSIKQGTNHRASTPTQNTFPSSLREHTSPKRLSSHHHPRISELSSSLRASTPSNSSAVQERPWVEDASDYLPSLRTRLAADASDRLDGSKSRSSLRFQEETALLADEARRLGQRLVAKKEEARLKLDDLEGAKYKETDSRKTEEMMRKREEKLWKESEQTKQMKQEVQKIAEKAKEEQTKAYMLAEDTRKREEDIQTRERALYSREKDIKQREEDVLRREDNAKKMEDDAKQKESELRSKEEVVRQREETLAKELEQTKQLRQELQKIAEQAKEDQVKIAAQVEDTRKRAQDVQEREQAVYMREMEVRRREQHTPRKEDEAKNAEEVAKEKEAQAKRMEDDALEAERAEARQREEVERFLQEERDRVVAARKQDEEEEEEDDEEDDDDDEEEDEEDPKLRQQATDERAQEEENRRKLEREREEAINAEAARLLQFSDFDGPILTEDLLEHPKIIEEQKYIWQQLQFENQANIIQRKRKEERSRIDGAAEPSSRLGDPSPPSTEMQSSSASSSQVLNAPIRSASTMPTLASSTSSLGLGQPSYTTQTSPYHARASSAMSWVKPGTPRTSPQMARVPSLLPSSPTLERRNSTPTPWLPPSLNMHTPISSNTSSAALSQLNASQSILPPGKLHTRSVSSSTTYSSSASTHSMTGSKDWQRSAHVDIMSNPQERLRREQESLEAQALSRSAGKIYSHIDIQKVFEAHERLWSQLSQKAELKWYDFPWPMAKAPADPRDLSSVLVSAYIHSPYWPEKDPSKTMKDRIKDQMKRWHPDTFETKYLIRVTRADKDKVRQGAGSVARYLSDLLWQENETSPGKDRVEKKHPIYVAESDREKVKMGTGTIASNVSEQPFSRARAASASYAASSRPPTITHAPYVGVSSASSSLGPQSPVSTRTPSLFSRASSKNIHSGVSSSSNLSWSTSNRHSLIAEEVEEVVTSGKRREDRAQVQRSQRVEEEVWKEGRWEEARQPQEDPLVVERPAYDERNYNAASRKPKAQGHEDRRSDQSAISKGQSTYTANRERRERERKGVKVVVEESDDETQRYRGQSISIDSRANFGDVESKPILVPKPGVPAGTYASIIGYRE